MRFWWVLLHYAGALRTADDLLRRIENGIGVRCDARDVSAMLVSCRQSARRHYNEEITGLPTLPAATWPQSIAPVTEEQYQQLTPTQKVQRRVGFKDQLVTAVGVPSVQTMDEWPFEPDRYPGNIDAISNAVVKKYQRELHTLYERSPTSESRLHSWLD